VLFFGCSIGTALAPNLAAFFVFRVLTAFEGTAFILVGSACIGSVPPSPTLFVELKGRTNTVQRYLSSNRARHGLGMVPLRDADRSSSRSLYRRHHRNLHFLESHLLVTNRSIRACSLIHLNPFAPRNYLLPPGR
jgi:hypothetical protein